MQITKFLISLIAIFLLFLLSSNAQNYDNCFLREIPFKKIYSRLENVENTSMFRSMINQLINSNPKAKSDQPQTANPIESSKKSDTNPTDNKNNSNENFLLKSVSRIFSIVTKTLNIVRNTLKDESTPSKVARPVKLTVFVP
ncbi:hypothetical protein AYI69_g2781, partial [Smittium culicis]